MAKDQYLVVSRGDDDMYYTYEAEHVDMSIARTAAQGYARADSEKTFYVARIMCGFEATTTVKEI